MKDLQVTDIQFFDQSFTEQVGENEFNKVRAYQANIVINDKYLVQWSGNDNEAHRLSIPTSDEQSWKSGVDQDHAYENFDADEIEKFLESDGYENNFNFLSENATETPLL